MTTTLSVEPSPLQQEELDVARAFPKNRRQFDRPPTSGYAQRLENVYLRKERAPVSPRRSRIRPQKINPADRRTMVPVKLPETVDSPSSPNLREAIRRNMAKASERRQSKVTEMLLASLQKDEETESANVNKITSPPTLDKHTVRSPKNELGKVTMSNTGDQSLPEPKSTSDPPPDADRESVKLTSDAKTEDAWFYYSLAKQHCMGLRDVRYCQTIFNAVDEGQNGFIDYHEFRAVADHIKLDATGSTESSEDLAALLSAWWCDADSDQDGKISFPEFVSWFAAHSFEEGIWLCPKKLFSRAIAKEMNLSIVEVERLKDKFDVFDSDGSGNIDFEEFDSLLEEILEVPKGLKLPPDRTKYFWHEINLDGDDSTNFKEFLLWYLKYFSISGLDISPIKNFYLKARIPLGCEM